MRAQELPNRHAQYTDGYMVQAFEFELDIACTFHFCSNNAKHAQLLLNAGANVNSRNGRGVTSLGLATITGHYEVMKVLLLHPEIDITVQVCVLVHK